MPNAKIVFVAFFLFLATRASAENPSATPALQILTATRLGSAGEDDLQDASYAPGGALYVAGNFGDAPAIPDLTTLGDARPNPIYSRGAILRLNADGTKVERALILAPGVAKITTVLATADAVYVAGYATDSLEKLVAGSPGLFKTIPTKAPTFKHFTPGEHRDEPKIKKGSDQRGAPFVARLDADLTKVTAATFLEGYQSLWHVPENLQEDHFQPVCLARLSTGEIVVAHDGGYNVNVAEGELPTLESFYTAGDYVSKLPADLSKRIWKLEIHSPEVDPARASIGVKRAWTHPYMGNTRIFRLRADAKDQIYISGWSASRTTKEPWWSPFLRKYSADGKLIWKAWEFDPTSGTDQRLDGLVSDAFVRTVNVDDEGFLLTSMVGDGGNNILRNDPRDYKARAENLKGSVSGFKGRILFWGAVARLDPDSRELVAGNHLNASGLLVGGFGKGKTGTAPVWANDLVGLPEKKILAVGRNENGFDVSEQAGNEIGGTKALGSFVRLYDQEFGTRFTAGFPDADLTTGTRSKVNPRRVAVVGTARSEKTPTTKNAISEKPLGLWDGYLVVVELPSSAGAEK